MRQHRAVNHNNPAMRAIIWTPRRAPDIGGRARLSSCSIPKVAPTE